MYGRDARLLKDSVLDMAPSPYSVDSEDYRVELVKGLSSGWEIARSEVKKAQKEQHDKKAKPVGYQEGGRVMVLMLQEKPLARTGT